MTPSIRKALNERANFYRRKLTFYENLGVLASSMTSQEIQARLAEANCDLNSSQGTSIINNISSKQGVRNSVSMTVRTTTPKDQVKKDEKKSDSVHRLPELCETPDKL